MRLLLVSLALACGPSPTPAPDNTAATPTVAQPKAGAPSALQADLLARPLAITRHGACRMDCRKIDRGEVEAVLRSGRVEPDRTRTDGPCPSHAIAGAGTDGHRLRVVFAACPDETRVVTAIDLDQDWPCACD